MHIMRQGSANRGHARVEESRVAVVDEDIVVVFKDGTHEVVSRVLRLWEVEVHLWFGRGCSHESLNNSKKIANSTPAGLLDGKVGIISIINRRQRSV